jgi:hypothetical protein
MLQRGRVLGLCSSVMYKKQELVFAHDCSMLLTHIVACWLVWEHAWGCSSPGCS